MDKVHGRDEAGTVIQEQPPEPDQAGSHPRAVGPRGVQLSAREKVVLSLRPCPSGTWYAYLLTVGLWEFWRRARTYTLTNQRIIETQGILSKTDRSLPLFFVQDAILRTWFFPRWGTVGVSTAGEQGGFARTLWLRRDEARALRDGIVQEAQRSRQTQAGLRPGANQAS